MNKLLPFFAISLTVVLVGCGGDSNHATGDHFHNSDNAALATEPGVWPPILSGIENEQALQGTALAGARSSIVNAMRAGVLNNPSVKQALGTNFREFDATLTDSKSEAASTFLFYNYETNVTVEASFAANGTVTLTNTPAARFQPSEHIEELQQAIALAKDSLSENQHNVEGLIGTAMLAYPPIAQIQNKAETFYPERVLYVTFGAGAGEIPEYRALVNLSNNTVSQAKLVN